MPGKVVVSMNLIIKVISLPTTNFISHPPEVPMDLDGDISEHEESAPVSAQPLGGAGNGSEADVVGAPGGVGDEPGPGDGESDTELDLLVEAETESDSDDNHSNQDAASAQRSVQTGATAGSDGGMNSILLYPEDESGESSQQEDDESEAGETDEQDTEEFQIGEEQLERRRFASVKDLLLFFSFSPFSCSSMVLCVLSASFFFGRRRDFYFSV